MGSGPTIGKKHLTRTAQRDHCIELDPWTFAIPPNFSGSRVQPVHKPVASLLVHAKVVIELNAVALWHPARCLHLPNTSKAASGHTAMYVVQGERKDK
jgi:hypothetical protein